MSDVNQALADFERREIARREEALRKREAAVEERARTINSAYSEMDRQRNEWAKDLLELADIKAGFRDMRDDDSAWSDRIVMTFDFCPAILEHGSRINSVLSIVDRMRLELHKRLSDCIDDFGRQMMGKNDKRLEVLEPTGAFQVLDDNTPANLLEGTITMPSFRRERRP